MSDEALSWLEISCCLKELLSDYNLEELDSIGSKQRLTFECFQTIIYHIFLIVDPNDCRRKFRLIYPTGNNQEQTRFLEQAILFINSKKLVPSKVAVTQLRTCGGEPFRRILGQLISKAIKLETDRTIRKSRFLVEFSNDNFKETSTIFDGVNKDTERILNLFSKYKGSLKQHEEYTASLKTLTNNINEPIDRKELLSKIKESSNKCSDAFEVIKKYSTKLEALLINKNKNLTVDNLKQQHQAKRISQIIREVEESAKSPKVDTRLKQLREFNEKLEQIILCWKQQVFDRPEVRERYGLLMKMIPPLKIIPINWAPTIE